MSVSPTGSGTAGLLLMKGTEPGLPDEGAAAGASCLSLGRSGPQSRGGAGPGLEAGEGEVPHAVEGEDGRSAPEVGAGAGSEGKTGEGSGVTTLTHAFWPLSQLC